MNILKNNKLYILNSFILWYVHNIEFFLVSHLNAHTPRKKEETLGLFEFLP